MLHASLRWRRDVPVYVLGAAAALSLGPDALNLAGTRMGAARVCAVIRPTLRRAVAAGPAELASSAAPAADVGSQGDAGSKRGVGNSGADAAAAATAAEEDARAARLEELAVDYDPRKGTVAVRGRPAAAAKGTQRANVTAADKGRKKKRLPPSAACTRGGGGSSR